VKRSLLLSYFLLSLLWLINIQGSPILQKSDSNDQDSSTTEHTSMDAPKALQENFKKEDFKPYMLKHYNEGCPTNSTCTVKMGLRYKKWSDILSSITKINQNKEKKLDQFRKKEGIPFEVWVKETDQHNPNLITWESHCNFHNQEGKKKIKLGTALIANIDDLNSLEKENTISSRKLYLLDDKNKKVTRFRVPQVDSPLYIEGDKLIYQRSENGHYYGLSISAAGNLKVMPPQTPQNYPKRIPCPEVLEKARLDHSEDFDPEIYSDFYCRNVWNTRNKKWNTILLGWSCD
jgi:hypothetical protein